MDIATLTFRLARLIKHALESTLEQDKEVDKITKYPHSIICALARELLYDTSTISLPDTDANISDNTDVQQHLYTLLEQQCPTESPESNSTFPLIAHPFRFGISSRPHYITLAYALAEQIISLQSSQACILDHANTIVSKAMRNIHLLNVTSTVEQRIITAINEYTPLWINNDDTTATEEDQLAHSTMFEFLFNILTLKDYAPFLGLQTTVGSVLMQDTTALTSSLQLLLPPSLDTCIGAFTRRYLSTSSSRKPKRASLPPSQLTVGAKALSKHSHRDMSQSFWGVCTGSDHNKNKVANIALSKILASVVWRNLHQLPHNIIAYEIRNEDGYGARWTYTPSFNTASNTTALLDQWQFRGLLEPQMVDGHEQGWKH
ncbi:hypothetical protein BDF19DRAFT_437347 [Syncephalis fuscata]|nr:hypothetical protein BDF19DRAFT_437347 [Syncephalis fuscata]